ncbi:hypothetical protein [Nocardia jejuensis]|uniref:WXG100-like domain-containing protein n=1 Tax=Nocardia jejuensis TaxID=328049 RepID=UPI0008352117|nr:hypothetical protein [Nocardia jejuensis]
MALEFPSWLEWLEWLVGSDWPHGNEDVMWQMGRDLQEVAADADGLIGDLDTLLADVRKAYPDGTGGDGILEWLTPLRDGDENKHGSLQELVDNYHALAQSADGMGDQLQSAKLNFYIAGAWLVGELAWAAASGPFAPAAEAGVIMSARIAFRELSERLAGRIIAVIERNISNTVLKRVLPKLVYEIGQEALVETFQGSTQEFLVQTIQQQTGHTDGYDWGAIGNNAAISALAGGVGGGVGFGAHHYLPTDAGGFKGAFNGALTGATAGAAGAGAAWLGGGMLNGNWEFDPRSLTGGAFSGAGPSALHGYNGHSDLAGTSIENTGDGSRPSTNEPALSRNTPDTDARTPDNAGNSGDGQRLGGNGTEPGDSHANGQGPGDSSSDGRAPGEHGNGQGPGDNQQPGQDGSDQQRGAGNHDSGGSRQQGGTGDEPGGPGVHSASAPTVDAPAADAPVRNDSDSQTEDRSGGQEQSVGVDSRNNRPDANPNTDVDGGDSTTASGPDSSNGAGSPDTHGGEGASQHDSGSGAHDRTGDSARVEPESRAPGSESKLEVGPRPEHSGDPTKGIGPQSNSAAVIGGSAPGATTAPGVQTPAAHGGQPSASSGTTSANTTGTGDTRAPGSSDPAKAAPVARTDGSAPRPVAPASPAAGPIAPAHASVSDIGDTSAFTAPIQAGRTGVEVTTPTADFAGETPHTGRPDHTETGSHAQESSDPTAPAAGPIHADVGPVVVPIATDPTAATRSDNGARDPQRGNASPVGDFDGLGRPVPLVSLTDKVLLDHIVNNLGLITPEGVSYNGDTGRFLLPDGRTITVSVGQLTNGNVAEFHTRPATSDDPGGFDITVSERARDQDVVRAVAHELAEIRLATDPDIDILIDADNDRPDRMTSHLGGRFAELDVLTEEIDRAAADPAHVQSVSEHRRDLADLMDRLGFFDAGHADTVRQLLAEHDPMLARRLELEQQGLHEHRPVFDPSLSDADFDHSAADHLNQLRQLLDGDFADDVVRAEAMALDGRMREELARRVFDPLFDDRMRSVRKLARGLFAAIDPINTALNDPALHGQDRADAVHRAIDGFHDAMPEAFRDAFGPERFAQMHAAADSLVNAPDRVTGMLDHETGRLTVDGEPSTLNDLLHTVDRANRGAAEHGVSTEYVVVVHDAVDGKSSVEVLSRPLPQHRLPLPQNAYGPDNSRIDLQPRPPVPAAATGGHTIDVGVGRSAFGVEMTPAADLSGGGLVIKTELADKAIAAQRRRDLGLLDPGPLTEPGTVMVFGNLLSDGHLLGDGPNGDVARIFINNVSADLPDAVYDDIAAKLADILAPGGRVEVQWDMKPEEPGGERGDRKHILGTTLWQALERHYFGRPNPFRVIENTTFPHPGNADYDYSIDAGGSNVLNTARMAEIDPPLPERRMIFVYEPSSYEPSSVEVAETPAPGIDESPESTGHEGEHGTASPVGEFHGDARPEGVADLTTDAVLDRVRENLSLIAPEGVTWNPDQGHFVLPDGRTVRIEVGPTQDGAVAEFHSRPDGYDVQVSPRARDVDVVRALAHELAEITLLQQEGIHVDPSDDRPLSMTPHLGGRFAEMRVLTAQIDEVSADRARAKELPALRRDLIDLMDQVGFHDPDQARVAERLLAEHDPELAHRIEQAQLPGAGMLRPGALDPDATPSDHDLGRIQQVRELAERGVPRSPAEPATVTDLDPTRREGLALVERLGLREGTPGAAERRAVVSDRLDERGRRQVEELLADVGRPDYQLSEADRRFVETVRIEARAADALDFLSQPFHQAVMRVHRVYRAEVAEHVVESHVVEDPDSGARWFRWPPTAADSAHVTAESSPNHDPTADHEPTGDHGLPVEHGLPSDPEQLREHWSQLSPQERDAWHREDPYVGNRDGIPQADRDHYNRRTLAALREDAVREQHEERLKQIDDMLTLLDAADPDLPPHLLSYVDEKLQYIYALGNPDTAQHVAIALAGAFRRRSGVGYALQTLAQLRQASLAMDPTGETSVLLFGAYDNPNSLITTLSSKGAEDGAQKVREFHEGLRVTHQGPPANITTIAHSYGGVTGGHSAGHGHALDTDALVFIGSWGTGVASVADLRLTGVDAADLPNHVFATMAEHDSIQLMPSTHGPAPDDPAFGATVFESDSTPSRTRLGWNPDDHQATNYFDSNNQSYASLGLIIAGLWNQINPPGGGAAP